MGRYTSKTTITRTEHTTLAGLLALGKQGVAELNRVGAAVAEIIGEAPDPCSGHAYDAVYGGYSADELLKKSEIAIVDDPMVSPTCELIVGWAGEDDPMFCGAKTAAFYPAASGGTMALCDEHAKPHANSVTRLAVEGEG